MKFLKQLTYFILLFISIQFLTSCVIYEKKNRDTISPYHVNTRKGDILLLEDREYYNALLDRINHAKNEITVSMYVFTTSGRKTNTANRIKDTLIRAAKRGLLVRVLLEREDGEESSLNQENEYTGKELSEGGVKVYFDSPHRRTHVKAIVIDNRYTFIGSHNLTASALGYNREISLMVDSPKLAESVREYILRLMKED